MARSFLNLLDLSTGREVRAAEFGFDADSPSFAGNTVVFRQSNRVRSLDLSTGQLADAAGFPGEYEGPVFSPDRKALLSLRWASEPADGDGYVMLVLTEDAEERVLVRFMGSERSLGIKPFSDDGRTVVFFGYPSEGGAS